jgi:uncharacterized protein
VERGRVIEKTGPDTVKAEIKVRMGAMSMTFTGTAAVVQEDPDSHRAVLQVKSREAGGQGHANADVTFALSDGGGTIHTAARITGKAASMGEGVVISVLDALINDFTGSWRAFDDFLFQGSRPRVIAMAQIPMRHVQPARSRRTAAPPFSSNRSARCSPATAPMTTCAPGAGTCSR